jgi:hypothetical protein
VNFFFPPLKILSAVILFTARRPVERRNRNRWMISFESKKSWWHAGSCGICVLTLKNS